MAGLIKCFNPRRYQALVRKRLVNYLILFKLCCSAKKRTVMGMNRSAALSQHLLLLLAALLLLPDVAVEAFSHRGLVSRRTHAALSGMKQPRWINEDVNQSLERIESVKAAVLTAVGGSLAAAPVSVVEALANGGLAGFDGQWEFNTDMLAVELFLFGVCYRYCVREDGNPMLKQGVVGAFAIERTLSLIRIPASCAALPLNCGPPLGYVSWDMISQAVVAGLPSFVAFGAAALLLEVAFEEGWVGRFR